jgi:GLPGLI family protein
MKSKSIKLIVSCLVLLIAFTVNAQDFQGKAYYFSKTSVDMDNFGGRQMSEEMKKQIAERMKSMFERTYILTFNREESLYKEEEVLEAPGQGGGRFRMMGGNMNSGPVYKNVKGQRLLEEQEFFGKQFLIKDSLPKLDWQLSGETKQIGQYLCMKATAIKKVDQLDFRSMRARGRDRNRESTVETAQDSTNTNNLSEEIEIPKEIEVTAWYTLQIPVNQGPGEYWGLPGLILEVNADRTTILCSKIIMNPDEKDEIKVPSKGKEVTRQEYTETVQKKMEEMREMYRGRDGGGRRGIRIRG